MSAIAPLLIEPAYEDPEAVHELVKRLSPHPLMAALSGYGAMMDSFPLPWFRSNWALDGVALDGKTERLLDHEPFMEGVRRMYGAEIVRPITLLVNLMGPMDQGAPHVDTPSFRGLRRDAVPIWLLVTMGMSGLFARWQIRVAGGLTWFSEASDGTFDYWPAGLDRPAESIRPPFGNRALLTDSDRMYHRVGAIGSEAGIERFRAETKLNDRSVVRWNAAANAWDVLNDGATAARLAPAEMRISLLWKALVFDDAADARRYDDHVDDLDADTIVSVFRANLDSKGIAVEKPSDPFTDPAWSRILTDAYLRRNHA